MLLRGVFQLCFSNALYSHRAANHKLSVWKQVVDCACHSVRCAERRLCMPNAFHACNLKFFVIPSVLNMQPCCVAVRPSSLPPFFSLAFWLSFLSFPFFSFPFFSEAADASFRSRVNESTRLVPDTLTRLSINASRVFLQMRDAQIGERVCTCNLHVARCVLRLIYVHSLLARHRSIFTVTKHRPPLTTRNLSEL